MPNDVKNSKDFILKIIKEGARQRQERDDYDNCEGFYTVRANTIFSHIPAHFYSDTDLLSKIIEIEPNMAKYTDRYFHKAAREDLFNVICKPHKNL